MPPSMAPTTTHRRTGHAAAISWQGKALPRRAALLAGGTVAIMVLHGHQARAQVSEAQMQSVEQQLRSLKAELRRLQQQEAAQDRRIPARPARTPTPLALQPAPITPQIPAGYALLPAAPGAPAGALTLVHVQPPPKLPQGSFQIGAVTVQLGGFLSGDGVYRSRNSVEDIQSNYTSGIPLANSPLHHEGELTFSARLTRLTALATANPDENTRLRSYISIDFQGAATTANSNESNSWTPRLREAWVSYDRSDWGFEVLAGQAWSLLTMNRVGMDPLNVNPPQTIDPNYVPGFTYARQAQLRLTKSFLHDQYHLALSVENPETTYGGTTPAIAGSTINITNPGTGVDGNTTISSVPAAAAGAAASAITGSPVYSNNFAPDVIVKATADYNLAHLEAFGIGRMFNDRVSQLGTGENNSEIGGGGGAAALIHVIPKLLDFQVSGLAGRAISRYDPVQLPDSTITANGRPNPLPGYEALVGLIGHPVQQMDLYAYLGTDQVSARYSDVTSKGKVTAYGYGNPLYDNAGCSVEGAPGSTCVGNTSGVVQATLGAWYRLLHGDYGTVQVGTQYAYSKRFIFQGVGPTPKSDSNAFFFSLRYFPFQ